MDLKSGGKISIGKVKLSKNAVMLGAATGVGIIAYAYYMRGRGGGDIPAGDGSSFDPNIDPATGIPYSDEYGGGGGTGGYSGLGIYDPVTGQYLGNGYGSSVVTGVSTNAAWTQACVAYLVSVGYEGMAVNSALGKVLSGQAVTQDELNIFNAATAAQGHPPQGYPTIKMASGQPGGTTNPPGANLPAPTGFHVDRVTRSTAIVDWNDVKNATGYRLYLNGAVRYANHPAYSLASYSGLKPNTSYRLEVRAIGADGGVGAPASLTVKTPK